MKLIFFVFSLLCALSSAAVLPQNVRELTDMDFQTTVQNNNAVLVTFFSPTCPHCEKFLPELEKAASSLRSSGSLALIAKVNCARGGSSTCSQAQVATVPTIRLYRNGQPRGDFVGERNSESVLNFVNEAYKNGLMRDNPSNGYNLNNGYNTNNGYNADTNGYNPNNGYNANTNGYNPNNGYNANTNGYNNNNGYNANNIGYNNNPGSRAWKPY